MSDWMTPFLKFLSYSNKTLEDPDEEDEAGPIEKLQTAIIDNVRNRFSLISNIDIKAKYVF